jgi:K+-transporting ATPase c subunit
MIKNIFFSLIIYVSSLALVFLYCATLYVIGHRFWPEKASGSLIFDKTNQIRGSLLLSQKLNPDINPNMYFTGRPIGNFANNCNVALYSESLKTLVLKNHEAFKQKFQTKEDSLFDISALVPSASLLDPYITKHEALAQAQNIATARHIDVNKLIELIANNALSPSFPFFEVEIVNTTLLNTLLDGWRIKN